MAAASAAGVAGDTKVYTGKLTLYVLLPCGVAATGGLIIGYDIGISVWIGLIKWYVTC
uniref:Major facilitator superfamily (MFS) profile domain-containing protein n=1 Tax=Oryza brachyantha TaxID=4533 RepID=J3LQ93_ORYBR